MTLHPPRRLGAAFAGLVALGLLVGCEGTNAWTDLPTTPAGRADRTAPAVEILAPTANARVAVQDSVRVEVRVRDDVALDSLTLAGFAVRGDPEIAKPDTVARYLTRRISLRNGASAVREDTVRRFLLPTADLREGEAAFIRATVRDTAGNVTSSVVRIGIGGPRINIVNPLAGQQVRAGAPLRVAISARDTANRVQEIILITEGAFASQTSLPLDPPRERVDTAITINVPASASGELRVRAALRSLNNDRAETVPMAVSVVPAGTDLQGPTVQFTTSVASRVEPDDSLFITITASDSSGVESVGATVVPILTRGTRVDTLTVLSRSVPGAAIVFALALPDLGVTELPDTAALRLETTAFARDARGNCAAATVPSTPLSEACVQRSVQGQLRTVAARSGARSDLFLVRGATVPPPTSAALLVDLAAVENRVYATNLPQNRLDVLRVGELRFSETVAVGAQPWGITVGRSGDTLYVANSAGTDISAVSTATRRESRRIRTSDVRLYHFEFNVESDSISEVASRNYSDRPQYLGQLATGQLIYSTRPTAAAEQGTIRILSPAKDTTYEFNRGTEIFAGYAADRKGFGIVGNALGAELLVGKRMRVCPRRLTEDQTDPACVQGTATQVDEQLRLLQQAGRTDTYVLLNRDVATVGLTDTTFVAVSRDHSTLAFGEGGADPGRIFLFRNTGSGLRVSAVETEDLVGNAAERVISLGLNADGTLGVARGREVYFFDPTLRQKGKMPTGTPTGGSALDPRNSRYPTDDGRRRSFISGVDALGRPFVEIGDTYTFQAVRRIYTRDRIVGTMIAVPVAANDPQAGELAVRLFAITPAGVLQLGIRPSDLQ